LIVCVEFEAANRIFQKRQSQSGTACGQLGVPVVGTLAFHYAVGRGSLTWHLNLFSAKKTRRCGPFGIPNKVCYKLPSLFKPGSKRNLTASLVACDCFRHLQNRGVKITTGTIVDATIIHAPSSTKNREQQRDFRQAPQLEHLPPLFSVKV
jgi:hypothetical protein